MKNIGNAGGARNGAAIKDVVMQVISALAGAAAESDSLPPELKAILHLNAKAVLVESVHELAKDPAKALENAGAIFAPAGRSAEPKKR
jgi:ATP-dependent protease HslVU (ClpYQ) peptidase subunit